jgi:two-component system, NarL family, sensor histidine kinase DesK
MSSRAAATSGGPAGIPLWAVRRAPWFLVCLHLPFVLLAPVFVITRRDDLSFAGAVASVVMGLAVGALQLRHSLATARGQRPRGWVWTFLAMVVLAYVPLWWLTWDWFGAQWFVAASAAMVLRTWPRVVVVGGIVVGSGAAAAYSAVDADLSPGSVIVWTVYYLTLTTMATAALYGSARLVGAVEELYAARTELAELAVGRERLRVSRDLHDLLGQSLSAVSLKGDLAMRLLAGGRAAAARAEIESLTGVARRALRDVRAVARDEHVVSLPAEIDAAAALMDAAGIETDVDVDLTDLPRPAEEVLAWAVREGATNLLRHSDAQTCRLAATRHDGTIRLVMLNDGLRAPSGHDASPLVDDDGRTTTGQAGPPTGDGRQGRGRGLAGLEERARALSGSVRAEPTGDGRFQLVVEIPVEIGIESRGREITA